MRSFLCLLAWAFVGVNVNGQGLPPSDPADAARAGWPQTLSKWAKPSNDQRYIGYYVGGGAVSWRHGELPTPDEGTWGWDYRGGLIPRRVNLLWWHGRRYQGGPGAYKTDGPRLPEQSSAGEQHP